MKYLPSTNVVIVAVAIIVAGYLIGDHYKGVSVRVDNAGKSELFVVHNLTGKIVKCNGVGCRTIRPNALSPSGEVGTFHDRLYEGQPK